MTKTIERMAREKHAAYEHWCNVGAQNTYGLLPAEAEALSVKYALAEAAMIEAGDRLRASINSPEGAKL
ncbi:MAG: hypothetical protein JWQ89_3550 [Devosia sp.]|uniref:hypothetical protein n=1 Tax=Devosia sp. TaxID=1871048 RepID=UPI00260B25F5|nr:hypothetical protein [Devosia sp.]MDB5541823.1 hypothetical protein [Devosia sp.]